MSQLLRNPTIPAEIRDLVPRYLAGELSPADAEAFEEYCILHPEAATEVESERRLRDGLIAVHRSQTAGFKAPAAAKVIAAVHTTPAARPRWVLWTAIAAAAVAVLLAIVLAG